MKTETMNSMQRVMTALSHEEPDRVPLFLLLTMHGAKELGLSLPDYYSRAEYLSEGQFRLREKYSHDCLYAFSYAAVEVEAWGGEVVFHADGPPNSGAPFIGNVDKIPEIKAPDVKNTPCLAKVLDAIRLMKSRSNGDCPIIGVAMSPFSLPVMQMGFGPYLDLIMDRPSLFERLMDINEQFCVDWSNAQLEAGATAICYFDPVSSWTVIHRELYLRTGHPVAKRTLARIKGPTATHFASGRSLPILSDVQEIGTAVIGVSCLEDMVEFKRRCRGKLSILGNLNGVAMRRWSEQEAESQVRRAIQDAAAGGGFILSDNHGELPMQVSDKVLMAISESVRRWGRYPLA